MKFRNFPKKNFKISTIEEFKYVQKKHLKLCICNSNPMVGTRNKIFTS